MLTFNFILIRIQFFIMVILHIRKIELKIFCYGLLSNRYHSSQKTKMTWFGKKAAKKVGRIGKKIDKKAIQPVIQPVKRPIKMAIAYGEKYGTTIRPSYGTDGLKANVNYSK